MVYETCLSLTFFDVLCKELASEYVVERELDLLELWRRFVSEELFLNRSEHFFGKN